MIDVKDVIRMRIPYPSISSDLAVNAHMYVCKENSDYHYKFVKCQTLKPGMILNPSFKHFIDEEPDIERNPFRRTTRLDCDKLFSTDTVDYSPSMKTPSRNDVCDDLFRQILEQYAGGEYTLYPLNEPELISLNPLIRSISV